MTLNNTIVHLSDLHIFRKPKLSDLNTTRIFSYLNFALNRKRVHKELNLEKAINSIIGLKPSCICITGDVTQNGLIEEFESVEKLLSPFIEENIPTFLLLGNHDYYGMNVEINDKTVQLQKKLYKNWQPDTYIYNINNLEIITLNQAISIPLFMSWGKCDDNNLKCISHELEKKTKEETTIRVMLGHFPLVNKEGKKLFWSIRLQEEHKLLALINKFEIDAYLCGHLHSFFSYPISPLCTQYVADSVTKNARYSVFHYDQFGNFTLDK